MNEFNIQNTSRFLAKHLMLVLGTIAFIVLSAQSVQAQRSSALQAYTYDKSIFNLKFMLGLGGEVESEAEDTIPGWDPNIEDDLEPSLGGGLEVDFPLHKYFLLGGLFGFTAWITEDASDSDEDFDRGYLLDFAIVPKVRFPFEDTILAIYLGVPIGLCIDFLDEENFGAAVEEVDVGFGFGVSVLFGLQVNLSKVIGLMAEFGYTYHSFSHDYEFVSLPLLPDEVEVDSSMDQFALNLGFYVLM